MDKFTYQQMKYAEFPHHYEQKYKLNCTTHRELLAAIYKYEIKNVSRLLEIDPVTNERGYFLITE